MLFVNRYCLICTFLCAPFFSNGQIELADSLYATGDFSNAAVAYEYALFTGVPPTALNSTLLKKAYCLKQLGKFERAYQGLDRADFYTGNDSIRALVFYEYALNALLAAKPDMALSKIQEMRFEITDSSLLNTILPLEIIVLNELGRWTDAHDRFRQFAHIHAIKEDPYPEILSVKFKNPDKAVTLSYWLPGVGQMYAGYFWKGFISTLLNVSFFGFGGYSILNGYYFSGIFSGIGLFYMSYNGGARYAEVLAKKYNEDKASHFKQRVTDLLTRTDSK